MHHPDYTPERRAHALWWIDHVNLIGRDDIDEATRITAVIGLLICDDTGFIKADDLPGAFTDPWLQDTAQELLREARQDDASRGLEDE